MNSAQATEFQWMVLCFLVTSITAMVASLDAAPEDERFRLADGGGRLCVVILGEDLDRVAEDAALGVDLFHGQRDGHRLILPVALEHADLRAEVADPDDLRRRARQRSRPPEGDERENQHATAESRHGASSTKRATEGTPLPLRMNSM